MSVHTVSTVSGFELVALIYTVQRLQFDKNTLYVIILRSITQRGI